VDTLEWGTADRTAPAGHLRRGLGWLAPPLSVYLAGGGALLAIVAEVLPWAGAGPSSGTRGGLGIDNLNTISVLGYYLCWVGLLGLTGLVLATTRPATRRAAAGAALGVGAAQAMVLAGILRWIFAGTGLTDSSASNSTDSSASNSPSVGLGLFCAVLGVGLVVAAVLVAVRRGRSVRGASAMPAALPGEDEPAELTVQPVSPIDDSLFTRREISG
jgi:hypothetical protein